MDTSHVTRHTSHVTRHTSHVTRHTSHVTRHTSHVTPTRRAAIQPYKQRRALRQLDEVVALQLRVYHGAQAAVSCSRVIHTAHAAEHCSSDGDVVPDVADACLLGSRREVITGTRWAGGGRRRQRHTHWYALRQLSRHLLIVQLNEIESSEDEGAGGVVEGGEEAAAGRRSHLERHTTARNAGQKAVVRGRRPLYNADGRVDGLEMNGDLEVAV